MFELSIALKYLIPRWRYLSVSIISCISVFVIATVVWLTIVFFSATDGLEKRWTEQLINITAPVRVTPTPQYYQSYYYQIDSISSSSNYAEKNLTEKLHATKVDPYNGEVDEALPTSFPAPLRNQQGDLIDLAKTAAAAIQEIPNAKWSVFDTTYANTTIKVLRADQSRIVTQGSYLVAFDPAKVSFLKTVIPLKAEEKATLSNLGVEPLEEENGQLVLPKSVQFGQAILLPKSFRDSGVQVGDLGYFSYFVPSLSAVQEQQLPFYVAGFYDPGIIPIGGKLILVGADIVEQIQSGGAADRSMFPTGFNINLTDYKEAHTVQKMLQKRFSELGLGQFFTIETYDYFDFSKDIFQQLKSERNLFSLIAIIIITVACSNIVSMLIILVHDKHKEIAIMRALGASQKSIGLIFGLSGLIMGTCGSIIGAILAFFTVKNLPALLTFLSKLQGFDVLNATYYGEMLPTDVSRYAFILVIVVTALLSSVAGLIAAWKASHQNTSDALRAD